MSYDFDIQVTPTETERRIVAKLTCPECDSTASRWDEATATVDGAPKTCAVCPLCETMFGPVRFQGDNCYITQAED